MFQIVEDVLKVLREPFENRARIANPGEILLQRLKCIRALIPLFNHTHAKIVKDILVEVTQRKTRTDHFDKSRVRFRNDRLRHEYLSSYDNDVFDL
jgi:hypothetical protein